MTQVRKLVSMDDMSREWWDKLYAACCELIAHPEVYVDSCRGKLLSTMFYEPSTRTNFSFQAAAQRLGAGVFGFSDPLGTSVSKGETLADTIRMTASYADTIVIRSPMEGAATAASLYSEIPVINAGDGGHFHPTQTLTDLTTIAQKRGDIGGLSIGICGDLKYGRTVHSLVEALSMFRGISFYLISPGELRMPEYALEEMRARGQAYTESESLAGCISDLDVLYMTRVQRERFHDAAEYRRLKDVYVLTKPMLGGAKPDMLVMHPLPRYGEIARDVDDDPRAVYFDQARYGMFIRMALLLEFLHQPRQAPSYRNIQSSSSQQMAPDARSSSSGLNCGNPACVTQSEIYLPRLESKSGSGRCGYCDKKLPVY